MTTSSRHFLLCPGFMTDQALWSRMAPGLAALGTCTFADLSRTDDLEATARELLAAAPDRFILIGFSLGGFVAREIARLAPDRVRGLVLMNSSARPPRPEIAKRNAFLIGHTKERGFRGLSSEAVKKAFHPNLRDDEALIQEVKDMALRMGGEAFIKQLSIQRPDRRADLAAITCPTLVIWARQDELRSLKESQEMADAIPGAKLEVIEDCGHMTPMEAPDAALRLLADWLEDRDI
ncbi:MAG: alpha/beta hydrolase [Rhodospirillaceae bacterium]|nr:alpha/beta hydrolase [Magnetovibrio sp.]MAY67215.1 alpha/beta hydrolase [Rhodospirillaceae bacterium]|tara:strand:+ start:2075 stop:2782 length:708 start_codon:yes stop_codon:yes gene_type:complete